MDLIHSGLILKALIIQEVESFRMSLRGNASRRLPLSAGFNEFSSACFDAKNAVAEPLASLPKRPDLVAGRLRRYVQIVGGLEDTLSLEKELRVITNKTFSHEKEKP